MRALLVVGLVFARAGVGAEAAAPAQGKVSFINDVVPILTKAGCNAGACHAKAGNGQRGFRLSLLGFEPQEDYEHIVKEGRGRRVFPGAPDESLLLLKAVNSVPHGGGKRIDSASAEYQTIRGWIAEGLPYTSDSEPTLTTLETVPKRESMHTQATQQLEVIAHYSDGSTRDVTGRALYEPNDKAMAEVNETGLVKIHELPGNVAIMVRYQAHVSVFSASIPLGAAVTNLPPARNYIDNLVFANLKQIGVPPSPLCDDATFLRRVSIDIAGHLPTLEEARAFLDNHAPDKRDQLIESLLASSDYADYFANKWTAMLKNKRDAVNDITANFAFYSWMRDSLLANKPYDQIVRELLAATGTVVANPAVAWYKRVKEPQQQLEDVAQVFLGVRMQCAQCHHHPFERWSQADYYSFGAFFSQIGRKPTAIAGEDVIFHKRGIAQAENKKTRLMVKPAVLGGPPLDLSPDEDPRLDLANWMSAKENPFFAKSVANRYWKHFFRRGLVEPEDDIRESNPASNPELLEGLAQHFIAGGYDLKSLIREISQSAAYQLDSEPNDANTVDRQNFSRYYPKHLPAEVLLDAVDEVTGAHTEFADLPAGTHAISLPDNSYNRGSNFLKIFGRPEGASACECERVQSSNLAQSLVLMNAAEVKAKLSVAGGRAETLAKSTAPLSEKLSELYLAAFSRPPKAEETATAEAYLAKARLNDQGQPVAPEKAARQGWEDLLWAVINTKEFLYNH